ncbi:hypothetical protein ABW19_dt0206997 [Dactylella cylindrospora]|nr:hypothetical protein ABW19_dt0206997 [Dactylella cylindrospora]
MALFTYWLWWEKPQEVGTPIIIEGEWSMPLITFIRAISSQSTLLSDMMQLSDPSHGETHDELAEYGSFHASSEMNKIPPEFSSIAKYLDNIFKLKPPNTQNSQQAQIPTRNPMQGFELVKGGQCEWAIHPLVEFADPSRNTEASPQYVCACNCHDLTGIYLQRDINFAAPWSKTQIEFWRQLGIATVEYPFLRSAWIARAPGPPPKLARQWVSDENVIAFNNDERITSKLCPVPDEFIPRRGKLSECLLSVFQTMYGASGLYEYSDATSGFNINVVTRAMSHFGS